MPAVRAFFTSTAVLELDGAQAGFLTSAAGGQAFGEVVVDPPATAGVQSKHLGAVRYEDITMICGSGMSVAFWDGLQSALRGDATRHSGAIIVYDQTLTERRRLEFSDALITEINFPKLDAGSKQAAQLTVTLTPDHTRRVAPGNAKPPAGAAKRLKAFTQANFRVTIDGLADVSKAVAKVDARTTTP